MTNRELSEKVEFCIDKMFNHQKRIVELENKIKELEQSASVEDENLSQDEFKVGDRVQFKSWEEMEKEFGLNNYGNINLESPNFIGSMKNLCGTYATITNIAGRLVWLKDFTAKGDTEWSYTLDMLKPAADEPKCRFKVGDRVKQINPEDTHFNEIGTIKEIRRPFYRPKKQPIYAIDFDNSHSVQYDEQYESNLEPYTEPRWTFTDDEKVILKNLPEEYKWIARDGLGIYVYEDRPIREGTRFYSMDGKWCSLCLFKNLFQSLDWEDHEACEFRKFI